MTDEEKLDAAHLIKRFLGDSCRSWVYMYESDWNYLMDVVDKIEAIVDPYHGHFGVHISSNNCTIQATNFRSEKMANPPMYFADHYAETKIIATWLACVSFIKWYNQKDKQ